MRLQTETSISARRETEGSPLPRIPIRPRQAPKGTSPIHRPARRHGGGGGFDEPRRRPRIVNLNRWILWQMPEKLGHRNGDKGIQEKPWNHGWRKDRAGSLVYLADEFTGGSGDRPSPERFPSVSSLVLKRRSAMPKPEWAPEHSPVMMHPKPESVSSGTKEIRSMAVWRSKTCQGKDQLLSPRRIAFPALSTG